MNIYELLKEQEKILAIAAKHGAYNVRISANSGARSPRSSIPIKDDRLNIKYIAECIHKIQSYTRDGREAFRLFMDLVGRE